MQEHAAAPRQHEHLPILAQTPLAAVLATSSAEADTPHIWGKLTTPVAAVQVPGARSTEQTASRGTHATASSQTCPSLRSTLRPARPPCCRWTLQTAMLLRSGVLERAIRACTAEHTSGRQVSAAHNCIAERDAYSGVHTQPDTQGTAQTVRAEKSQGPLSKANCIGLATVTHAGQIPITCHSQSVFLASADCLLWGQLC